MRIFVTAMTMNSGLLSCRMKHHEVWWKSTDVSVEYFLSEGKLLYMKYRVDLRVSLLWAGYTVCTIQNYTIHLTFKPQWSVYVPPALAYKISAFYPQSVLVAFARFSQ